MKRSFVAAVMLIAACGAQAVVDLDAATPDSPRYARETLDSRSTTEGSEDGVVYFNVADAGTNNDVKTVLGAGIPVDGRAFLRFQLADGVLAPGNNARLTINGTDSGITLISGGAVGDNLMIFIVEAPAGLDASDAVVLELDELAISSSGPVSITYTLYETVTAAFFDQANLYTSFLPTYISTVEGASPEIEFRQNTADVSSEFRAFTNSSVGRRRANVGTVAYTASTVSKTAVTGNPATLPDVVNEAVSVVLLSGDFSFGTWFLDDNEDCTSADFDLTDAIVQGDGNNLTTSLDNFASKGFSNLCVEVDEDGSEIQADEYQVFSEPVAASVFALFDPVRIDGSIGVIDRNGTDVRIPSLTTFGDYQQRLTLVNYRDVPVAYSINFVTEGGVSATPLDAAEGVIPPNEKLVLRTQDIVTLEGGTRCAAALAARSRQGTLGISTTQVNLLDGSTDTVVYQ